MSYIKYFNLLLILFFLACGEEKEFMTPKSGDIVLDVNVEEYSLNGKIIGKTNVDISSDDNLLIIPLDNELKKIRQNEFSEAIKKGRPSEGSLVKIHLNDNLTYDDFYKVVATFGFSGFTSIQYVIGSNFKEVYTLLLPERGKDSCQQAKNAALFRFIKEMNGTLNLSNDEIWEQRIKEKAILIECARKYIDLNLFVNQKEDSISYMVGLNETGLTDGTRMHDFNNETDMWNFIEDIQSRLGLRDKEDRYKIVLVVNNDVLLKKITPIIKKLTAYGYKINFAKLGS